jgi:hypothetical protein
MSLSTAIEDSARKHQGGFLMSTLQNLLALVVLIYVLCVIVQFVQEGVKALFDTKAKTMEKVIQKFMGEDLLKPEQVEAALTSHGLDGLAALEHLNKDDFRKLMDAIPFTAEQLRILADANTTVEQFKDRAEAAYDGAMAKFQKLYAANNKKWVIALGFAVVLVLNASVIRIYEILTVNQAVSQTIATTASTVSQPNQGGGASQTFDPDKTREAITKELQNYPILLRTTKYPTDIKDPANDIGLIIMGILVSLGAPFWNDVLKGVTGVNNVLNTGGSRTPQGN